MLSSAGAADSAARTAGVAARTAAAAGAEVAAPFRSYNTLDKHYCTQIIAHGAPSAGVGTDERWVPIFESSSNTRALCIWRSNHIFSDQAIRRLASPP